MRHCAQLALTFCSLPVLAGAIVQEVRADASTHLATATQRHDGANIPPWAAFRGALRVAEESQIAGEKRSPPRRLVRRQISNQQASLMAFAEQDVTPAAASHHGNKLFIVLTGDKPHKALLAKDTWIKRVRWPDKVLFVCGPHCREDPRLDSVLVAPDLLRDKDSDQAWDYRQAAARGPWALQWAWKNIERTGHGSLGESLDNRTDLDSAAEADGYGLRLATKPFAWWIIADDDTFVNLPVLEKTLPRYASEAPVVLAENLENGGAGMVLNSAAAGNLTQHFWKDYLPPMRDVKGSVYGDHRLASFLAMKVGATVDSPPEFTQEAPTPEQLQNGTYRKNFATWHHAWYKNDAKEYETYIYNESDAEIHRLRTQILPMQDRDLRDDIEHPANTLEDYYKQVAKKNLLAMQASN